MRQSVAILSLLAGAACADDILSFIFPGGFDGPAPVATIQSAGPSTTAAVLTCPSDTPADECGFASGLAVDIVGGTRYQASMTAGDVYVSYGCDGLDTAARIMTCTADVSGEDPVTAVLSGSDVGFLTATIVEGAELLSGGASATASASASASASLASASASASATATAVPKSSASAASSSGIQTSASASGTADAASSLSGSASSTATSAPESTGAAVRFGIEGAALLALAGAVVANVL